MKLLQFIFYMHTLIAVTTLSIYAQEPELPFEDKISFSYENEDLTYIINSLAAKKNFNIILPQGPHAITTKVTLHLPNKITVNQAWDLLQSILDMAGYHIIYGPTSLEIVKTSNQITREPVPIYIGVKPHELPQTDQRIWYLYYLTNLKVPKSNTDTASELNGILKVLLPDNTTQWRFDQQTNALFIMASADHIRSVMEIITELDKASYKETIKIVNLKFANATTIADLFNKEIIKNTTLQNPAYARPGQPQSENDYFSQAIKITPDTRTNSIILTGRKQAVKRIIDFIRSYIDIPLDSGKSVLHVYSLQYLDAPTFAPILQKILKNEKVGGTGQSQSGASKQQAGPERFFDEVIVMAEQASSPGSTASSADTSYDSTDSFGSQTSSSSSDGGTGSQSSKPSYGSNKLIVAARNDDWMRIKRLIEELDTPLPQVLIEILVADLTTQDTRQLGSIIRNPANIPILNQSEFQAAHLPHAQNNPGIIPNSFSDPETIAIDQDNPLTTADILPVQNSNGGLTNPAVAATPGATMISFNDQDGSTWGVMQVLKLFSTSKILSHPHVIVTNNKEALVEIGQTRRVPGPVTGSYGGTTVQQNETIKASLTLKITPRISASGNINLTVSIDIDEFLNTVDNTRATRQVYTNANVFSSDILAIGGLIRATNARTLRKTPILGDIPIIGNLFKNRNELTEDNNLTVFICPTVIMPHNRSEMQKYTKDYVNLAKQHSHENYLFDSLHDPVTRFFFRTTLEAEGIIDDFIAQHDEQNVTKPDYPAAPKETKKRRRPRGNKNKHASPAEQAENTTPPMLVAQQEQQLKEIVGDTQNPLSKH